MTAQYVIQAHCIYYFPALLDKENYCNWEKQAQIRVMTLCALLFFNLQVEKL